MSFSTPIYFPIDLFDHEEDIDVVKYRLEKFSRKTPSRLKKEEFQYIINFSIKILYEYFDKDTSIFFTLKTFKSYIKLTMTAAFWISYKFLADEDDLYASEIANMIKTKPKEFLEKEREILLFINYDLFKLLKNFDPDAIICNKEIMFRASI